MRTLVSLVLPCAALGLALGAAPACSEPETPRILTGNQGGCGSVVQGASPGQVACPAECPIAVEAFRVINTASCERASSTYVACIRAGGTGQPGAALLDTDNGPIFVDDPSFDCNRDDGCAGVDTTTTSRWTTCADADEPACECVCRGGECAFDRFVDVIDGCGLPSPCEPITADAEPTEEQLQCYLDALANGDPIRMEVEVPSSNDLTGQTEVVRRVVAARGREAVRLDPVAFSRPAARCELQSATFFFGCDPDEPMLVNVENEQGMSERLPCTDPRAWLINCDGSEPFCPG